MKDVRAEAIPSSPLMRWWASWRLALRINRREAGRSKLRAAFIALTVGLPVLMMSAVTTFQISEKAPRDAALRAWFGSADARVYLARGDVPAATGSSDRLTQATTVQRHVGALLPGAHLTPVPVETVGVVNEGRWLDESLLSADLTRSPARSMVFPISGRLPRQAGEVVVTPEVRRALHGDHLQLRLNGRGYPAVVVGVVGAEHGVTAHPGTVPQKATGQFLVTRATPFSQEEMEQATRSGLELVIRHQFKTDAGGRYRRTLGFWFVLIMALGAFEVALLTAPAFTVGALRARQSVAQFALNGADGKQVRRVVLGQAVLLGWLPAVAGSAFGVATGWGVARLNASWSTGLPATREVTWQVLALTLGCAFVAALAGAAWATRGHGGLQVTHLLRHHPPKDLVPRRTPVVALGAAGVLAFLQILCALAGWKSAAPSTDGWLRVSVLLAVGAVVSVMFVVPWILSRLAAAVGRQPVVARLAARDALRQRSRSVSAVSAIIATFSVLATLSVVLAANPGVNDTSDPGLPSGWNELYLTPDDSLAVSMVRGSLEGVRAVPLYIPLSQFSGVGLEVMTPQGAQQSAMGPPWNTPSTFQVLRDEDISHLPFTPTERAVLVSGGIVNVTPSWVQQGRVFLGGSTKARAVSAVAGDGTPRLGHFMFATTRSMKGWGQDLENYSYLIQGKLSKKQARQLKQTFPQVAVSGPEAMSDNIRILLVASVLALLLAVFAAVSATVLSQAEQQQDLRTIRALGAPVRMTRRFGAAQAGLIAATGAVLGLGIGVVPGMIYAALDPSIPGERDLSGVVEARLLHAASCIPWGQLLLVGLFATLIAAGLGWLLAGERRSAKQRKWPRGPVSAAL